MGRKVYNKNEIRIRKMMIDKGITIQMIADHLEVSHPAIWGRIKRGTIKPLEQAINEIDRQLKQEEAQQY